MKLQRGTAAAAGIDAGRLQKACALLEEWAATDRVPHLPTLRLSFCCCGVVPLAQPAQIAGLTIEDHSLKDWPASTSKRIQALL